MTTDASGNFTVTTGLADGSYNWSLKGQRNLANAGTLTLAGGNSSPEMGAMKAGDCNNDNIVNVLDFNILKTTFGKAQGDPGYDARADFTRDQQVNISDFNLQKTNFGQPGASLTCP